MAFHHGLAGFGPDNVEGEGLLTGIERQWTFNEHHRYRNVIEQENERLLFYCGAVFRRPDREAFLRKEFAIPRHNLRRRRSRPPLQREIGDEMAHRGLGLVAFFINSTSSDGGAVRRDIARSVAF
ncbi:hypothetical protein [Methylosinus sporium]|uniref:hypothetical protein n=1 Tax=Methylosinus sporium TaxID=428 RepID=UPI001330AC27